MRDEFGGDGTHGVPSTARLLVLLLAATALGWGACAIAAHWSDVLVTDSGDLSALRTTVTVAVVLTGCGAAVLARFRPRWVPPYVVVATAGAVTGLATAALQGTRYGFSALHSDSAFRTEAVTRFTDSAALADYAYQDLLSYYPPAWPWLQGRAAAILDVPGWAMVKPATLLLIAVVPLVAFLLWRRVLPAGESATVVLFTTLALGELQKPDEWLVLMFLLPWWLEVVRGVRAEGVQPRRTWVDGLIVGGLLLTHSVYFLPLGLATVLGWAVDLVGRHPAPLPLRRMVPIGAVALVVSTPYWLPIVVARLTSEGSDNLQMRWSPEGTEVPPTPFEQQWWLPLAAAGVVWLLVRLRRDARLAGLALVLVAGYAVTVGGQWLQRYDVALLAHKAEPVVLAALVVAGVCAGGAGVRAGARAASQLRGGPRSSAVAAVQRFLLPMVVLLAAAVLVLPAASAFTDLWAAGKQAQVPHQLPYPDGTLPEGFDPDRAVNTWGTEVGDPSTEEVLAAWRELSGRGPEDDTDTVLLTTRVDLLATTPVHPFTTWKSIYSHPNGQYEQRFALLLELARCPDSDCAAALLRDNPYDRVHGVIASRNGNRLELPLAVDNFPEGWDSVLVSLPLRLFSGPQFRRTDVGPVTVVVVD